MELFLPYLLTLLFFFLIDILWLGLLARGFYDSQIGFLRSEKVNWAAGLLFYFLFNLGLLLFAVAPALDAGSASLALQRGALYGFFTYMTYDLTNLATLKDWPVKMVVVDILWGTALCAAVAWAVAWSAGILL